MSGGRPARRRTVRCGACDHARTWHTANGRCRKYNRETGLYCDCHWSRARVQANAEGKPIEEFQPLPKRRRRA